MDMVERCVIPHGRVEVLNHDGSTFRSRRILGIVILTLILFASPSLIIARVFPVEVWPADAGSADWAVYSVGMQPLNPIEGDQVVFVMEMTQLSGQPQKSFMIQCQIDAESCGSKSFPFDGGLGAVFRIFAPTLWTATLGTHTLTMSIVAPDDPNQANNEKSSTFTVAATGATTPTSINTPSAVQTQTTTQIETITQTTTTASPQTQSSTTKHTTTRVATTRSTVIPTTQTGSPLTGGFFDTIQQNSLILVGILALAVVLAVTLARRRRRPLRPGVQTRPAATGFCLNCGRKLKPGATFCTSCGTRREII